MTTIPVTFYRAATYTEGRMAEIDPHEYVEWCNENGHDSTDLDALQNYVLNEYCGDYEEMEGEYEESEFRQFDDAGYANWLTAAALASEPQKPLPEDELRRIVMNEITRYGRNGRPMDRLGEEYGLSEADMNRAAILIMGSTITISL